MLFNSYAFILAFVPVVIGVYHGLTRRHAILAQYWLILVSAFFYAWWRPFNVLLIAPSIAINFALVTFILRASSRKPRAATWAFWSGIAFNLAFLGYFKYRSFGVQMYNDLAGTSIVIETLILPLGISFITFQKIALLVDVRAGRVERVSLRDYALFVLFFPQLIAGPIVHFRELMPQFAVRSRGAGPEDFAVGLSLFFSGLFKKVMLADPIAGLIAGYWMQAAQGGHLSALQAWGAALGYMLQLYFDFSGYSDMAIGVARLFGIKLPYNFDSPLKAASIIDFWSRWHVTLTRFLTAYIFSPLTLSLTRQRLARGFPVVSGRKTTPRAFVVLLGWPTMVTMLLAGVWHGAGYQFLVFGGLHAAALIVNHAWRLRRPVWWPKAGAAAAFSHTFSWAVTFLFVVCAEVFFRSSSVACGMRVLRGMIGADGLALPAILFARVQPLAARAGLVIGVSADGASDFLQLWAWIALCLFIVLALPNSFEMLAHQDPALNFKIRPRSRTHWLRMLTWVPSPAWAVGLSGMTVAGLLSLSKLSDFLYWHF